MYEITISGQGRGNLFWWRAVLECRRPGVRTSGRPEGTLTQTERYQTRWGKGWRPFD